MAEHSFLSPSAAHKWVPCAVAPIREAGYPNISSPAAQKGTNAHKWAEDVLEGVVSFDDVPEEYRRICVYIAYVRGKRIVTGNTVSLEHAISIPFIRGAGTIDCVIVSPAEVEIVDLKFGKTPVDVKNNPQLILYALGYLCSGAYRPLNTETIRLTIIQPNSSDGHVFKSEVYPVQEIQDWQNIFKRQADKIFGMREKGTLEYTPGEHCTWCRHMRQCEAYVQDYFIGC